MKHQYICTDGKGRKIEITLPRIAYITAVAPQGSEYFFTVKYQANQGDIPVGEFVNKDDAAVERDSLEKAFQSFANSID